MLRLNHIAGGLAVGALSAIVSAGPVFNLDHEFSGAQAPAGTGPWMTVTFTQGTGANSADVFMSLAANLSGAEKVDQFMFNIVAPKLPTSHAVSFESGMSTGTFSAFAAGDILRKSANPLADATFKPDGDGYFDYLIKFDKSGSVTATSGHFAGTDVAVFRIAGTTASWFDELSEPASGSGNPGPFHAAAHVLGIAIPDPSDPTGGSGWIGDSPIIPLPTSAGMAFAGLLGLGCVRRRRGL